MAAFRFLAILNLFPPIPVYIVETRFLSPATQGIEGRERVSSILSSTKYLCKVRQAIRDVIECASVYFELRLVHAI